MKKVSLLLALLTTVFFVSCEGPAGPPGPPGFDGRDGLDGLDGVNILGTVIDYQDTFSVNNDYTLFFEFPNTVEVFETDVVLVYLLWDQTEDNTGQPVDIWRLLPQTIILNEGLLQYNYDHTFFDVSVFLDADFNLALLDPVYTDNQVFRVAILPADLLSGSRIDRSNIDQIMNLINVEEKDIQRYKLN